jgi:hypothetical protein
MNIIVGVWQVDTESDDWLAMTNGERLNLLRNAVTQFWANSGANTSTETYAALFTAPEYLFVRGEIGPKGKNEYACHHMEEAEKTDLRRAIATFQKDFPKLVLIPGTVLWRAPATKAELAKAMQTHRTFIQENFDEEFRSVELLTIDSRIEQGAAAKYQGYNDAWIFLGRAIATYGKMTDVAEAWDPEETLHIGGNDMVTLLINDRWFGIEICRDHTCGTLAFIRRGRPVDVQLILSAHLDAPYLLEHCCSAPPRVIHACSVSAHSGVFSTAANLTKSVRTESKYDVKVYRLPV